MQLNIDWIKILLQCKENVAAQVHPVMAAIREPQPDLGVGAGGDRTKLVDLAAEKAIVETFVQHDVSFTLVSEESGVQEYGTTPKNYYVTVDPIDGTTNFMHGLPFFCCSIAVSDRPRLSAVFAAMVTDLMHGVTYTALKGKGAQRNGAKMAPSQATDLKDAGVGIDLNTAKVRQLLPQLVDFIEATKHIRHYGANALELCFVADGLTDAFVDIRGKLRSTDVAASFLILKEAGAIITDPQGQPIDIPLDPKQTLKFVASGNPTLHKTILGIVKSE
jgi:myo-inositol-1(or 4)-monophosphatase